MRHPVALVAMILGIILIADSFLNIGSQVLHVSGFNLILIALAVVLMAQAVTRRQRR